MDKLILPQNIILTNTELTDKQLLWTSHLFNYSTFHRVELKSKLGSQKAKKKNSKSENLKNEELKNEKFKDEVEIEDEDAGCRTSTVATYLSNVARLDISYPSNVFTLSENDEYLNIWEGWIDTPRNYRRKLLYWKDAPKVRDFLVDNNIIEVDYSYSSDNHYSQRERLKAPYRFSEPTIASLSDKRLINKLLRDNQKRYNNLDPLYQQLENKMKEGIEGFDITGAYQEIAENNLSNERLCLRLKIPYYYTTNHSGFFSLSVAPVVGRVMNFITRTPKELRKYISPHLYEVDGSNYIPLLLNKYITESTPDSREYRAFTQEGILYDVLQELWKLPTREETKKMAMKLFFGKHHNPTIKKEINLFREIFPKANEALWKLKRKGYKNSSHILMKDESDIMIRAVAKDLLDEGIFFVTCHDAIYTTKENVDRIADKIKKETYKATGATPTIKIKDTNDIKLKDKEI